MESLKKIHPPSITEGGSLPYDAMLTQLIEWRMALIYMRVEVERGEDIDFDQYAAFLAAVDSAIDYMTTKMICSLTIHGAIPN